MRGIPLVGRSLATAGLVFGLFVAVAATGASAQADDVALTLHVLSCPSDTTGDIFEECHDNKVKDAEFDVAGTSAKSDDKGEFTVTVAAGSVEIEEIDFATLATDQRADVFCSPQPGGDPLSQYKSTDGKVTIALDAADAQVTCDWYNRTKPTAKRLWIHALECPVDAEGDIFEACHDNRLEGVEYQIDDTVVASDSDGVANFDNPPAGKVEIEELDFENIATAGRAYVHCSVQPGGDPVLFADNTDDGKVTLDVPADSEVHCDWYNRTAAAGPTETPSATDTPYPTDTPQPTDTPEPTEDDGSGGSGGSNATATQGTTLPDTGSGPTSSSSGTGFAFGLALIVLAVAGLAYGLRRPVKPNTDA
ncbi:MAG TPA: hypothetical protein VH482_13755 [Thermomicrobiales bacterium]|jgi:hypothetical protein